MKLNEKKMRGFVARHQVDEFALGKFGRAVEESALESLKRFVEKNVHRDCLGCKYEQRKDDEYKDHGSMSKVFESRFRCAGHDECLKELEVVETAKFDPFADEMTFGKGMFEREYVGSYSMPKPASFERSLAEMRNSLDRAGTHSDHAADTLSMFGHDNHELMDALKKAQPDYITQTKDTPNIETEGFGDW